MTLPEPQHLTGKFDKDGKLVLDSPANPDKKRLVWENMARRVYNPGPDDPSFSELTREQKVNIVVWYLEKTATGKASELLADRLHMNRAHLPQEVRRDEAEFSA